MFKLIFYFLFICLAARSDDGNSRRAVKRQDEDEDCSDAWPSCPGIIEEHGEGICTAANAAGETIASFCKASCLSVVPCP